MMTMRLTPFLMMDGSAKEAIVFYEQSLDAKVLFMQTFGQGPESTEETKDRIAHSVLRVGETELMVSDTLPGQTNQPGTLMSICITADDVAQSKHLFEALSQGGQVLEPLEPTYFSPAYGLVTDKFGATFQIFTKRPS